MNTNRKVKSMMVKQLAAAMAAQEKSRYRLSQESGISQGTLSELMAGTRALTMENAERLASAMGLQFRLMPAAHAAVSDLVTGLIADFRSTQEQASAMDAEILTQMADKRRAAAIAAPDEEFERLAAQAIELEEHAGMPASDIAERVLEMNEARVRHMLKEQQA